MASHLPGGHTSQALPERANEKVVYTAYTQQPNHSK